jgi:TaqI-like C-terminal specificity domain/Eco57I restriction-modification methylase
MPAGLEDVRSVDGCIRELLDARSGPAAITALKKLFVEELDFQPRVGSVALHAAELPQSATRVAERDGVQVVAVRLTTRGRVLVRDIREALKQIRETLAGDVLLAAGDAEGGEWQLVYPSLRGDKEILRRIVLTRGQPHRTVVTQLAKAYDQARRGDLRAALESAYDVEAVTKDFFRDYSRVFRHAESLITGLPDDNDRRLFCQTLFNRLMFIYFLQRKGWLTFNGSTDYLHSLWKDAMEQGENFYEQRLRLLFFVSLSSPRSTDYDIARAFAEEKTGKVPFLNGGLFSEDRLDKVERVVVPNEAIEPLLNEIFEKYNFTISESTPYDVQVAVDPEMLGKVFEELVTGRHGTGSYYTPRPVVSFMCRQALKGYLQTHVPEIMDQAVSRYVDDNDVSGITQHQAARILDALELITVIDPACGSGAYLLGMMQELLECEIALYNPHLLAGARSLYDMKLRIIERNVYGVDIDAFAVNIAMLRLWLSLIVEYQGPVETVPALPNLDFKIVCGDSLAGPDPDVPASTLVEDAVQRTAGEIAELKALYAVSTGEEKIELHREVEEKQRSLAELMAHTGVPDEAVDWRVAFAEVFERDGFDVVLANPPYVRQELIKEQKPRLREVYGALYTGTADLYVYFYYRALQLLGAGGMLVFISSNKWFRAAYGAKLRQLLGDHADIWSITDFGDLPVFESATAYPMVFIAQRAGDARVTYFTEVPSLGPPYPDVDAVIAAYGYALPPEAISGTEWRMAGAETIGRLDRMRSGTVPLSEYVAGRIYRGVLTGLNKAFVIDGTTRDALIAADPKSAEIIRPFVVGKDIRRWVVDYKDQWLITTKVGTNMRLYPAVLEHLSRWQPGLEKRWDKGDHWWELRACGYYEAFEAPKIVYQEIATYQSFAFDRTGAYTNNKVFIVTAPDLFLLGILNSAIIWRHLNQTCSKLSGGALALQSIYMSRLPIPVANTVDRAALEQLVETILVLRAQQLDVTEQETEINARVPFLYGLEAVEAERLQPRPARAVRS